MPVEFLTDEQTNTDRSFPEVPTQAELEQFFFLDDDDPDLIALRRTDGHRRDMALQICTLCYLGRIYSDAMFRLFRILGYPFRPTFPGPARSRGSGRPSYPTGRPATTDRRNRSPATRST